MSRPVLPRPLDDGPRMPESVLRRRPAQVVPPPRSPSRRLPPPPPVPGRHPFRPVRRRKLPTPPRVRGRRTVPIAVIAAVLVFAGLFAVAAGPRAATNRGLGGL